MNRQQIIDILNSNDNKILSIADDIRKNFKGDAVHLRALIEFSNTCKCNCQYCGIQVSNKTIKRYNMTPQEIIDQASFAAKLGYKTIVLQSGESNYYSTDTICEIIRQIKKLDVALTISIGEKSYDEYKEYKLAGADRYLLRIETTDQNLYKNLHPNSDYNNRVNCLMNLKKIGFETGSGSIVGLPGQSIESIADDILFFKENNFDMIGIGPFIPHSMTVLKDAETGSFDLALKVMAIVRCLMKDINIPATTAMETIKKNGQIIALQSGANVIMPNFTPLIYRDSYEIYPNKNTDYAGIESKLAKIGRYISNSLGNRSDRDNLI